ncbi:Helitron helicase [Phytophthora megakarya]|uniref:Helitron helicase n=1 Tax=Phytophthora megakarya TaxID=4795 RepID=A0A225W1H5_9STRA|nr:Helitron helicase [Phytophthora megakarya]
MTCLSSVSQWCCQENSGRHYPVIPRAGPAETISASIKRSVLWTKFERLRLSINLRLVMEHTKRLQNLTPTTSKSHWNYFDPKNPDVLRINEKILQKLPGQSMVYQSVLCLDGDDELQRQEHSDLYPPALLNNISLSGIPPYKLKRKITNLNTKEGLYNGTRLRIIEFRANCMKASSITGGFSGKVVLIPRVTLISKTQVSRLNCGGSSSLFKSRS